MWTRAAWLALILPLLLAACGPAAPATDPTAEPSPTTQTASPTPPPDDASPTPEATVDVTATPTATASPTPETTPTATPGPMAASALEVETACSDVDPRQGIAHLSWRPAVESATGQRVDVTTVRGGFESGDYASSEVLSPDESSLTWEELSGQAIHFWRVMTRHDGEWTPSRAESFQGPTCVADYAD